MRVGWGMDYALALSILIFLEGLILLKGLMELSKQIEDGLDEMDQTMAEAIKAVIENVGIGEPINPIQNALAQILTNNLAQDRSSSVIDLARDPAGQFTKKE